MTKKSMLQERQLEDAERWSWVTAALGATCSGYLAYSGDSQWKIWAGFAVLFVGLALMWRRARTTTRKRL